MQKEDTISPLINITANEIEMGQNMFYREMKESRNNFSYWFPRVEKCGIPCPESRVVPVPDEIVECFFMERETDEESIFCWVKSAVMPIVQEMQCPIFIKNGTFSDKFDFSNCCPASNLLDISHSIAAINYDALCLDAGGCPEIVIRERVGIKDLSNKYRIYNGMPLRPEIRVFYDYDTQNVLYSVNYWDWQYCHADISVDKTDKLAYEAAYEGLEDFYSLRHAEAEGIVEKHMQNVSGLSYRSLPEEDWRGL